MRILIGSPIALAGGYFLGEVDWRVLLGVMCAIISFDLMVARGRRSGDGKGGAGA